MQKIRTLFHEGKTLWQEYININGYSFQPTAKGITKLSKLLDLNKKYLLLRITTFLDS